MKIRPAIFAGFFAFAAALSHAQSRMGPQSLQEIYGANPTTSAPKTSAPPAPPAATEPAPPAPVAPPARNDALIVPLPPAPAPTMPGSMASIDNVQKLKPNDRFFIEIVEDRDPKPRLLYVDAQGNANFPYLGARAVKDKTLREVAFEVRAALEEKYYKAGKGTVLLTFSVASKPRDQYQIMGVPVLAQSQGRRDLPTDRPLLVSEALQNAGFYRATADLAHIKLIRPDTTDSETEIKPIDIDLTPFFDNGLPAPQDMVLRPGDTIFVQEKGAKQGVITVYGEVNNPGRMALPANEKLTVTQAILDRGGLSTWGHPKVDVIRHDKVRGKITLSVNINDILVRNELDKDIVLQDGDLVYVGQKLVSF